MADNCDPRKIDSNVAGLSFAETICGRLPTLAADGFLPTWYECEPNSYADFGGSITTQARSPISASRQRKKGTVVDLDAVGGYNEDFTQSNMVRRLQGFFFADIREKATTAPLNDMAGNLAIAISNAVAATDTFETVGGGFLARFKVGMLVLVSGFITASNNGLFRITGVTDTAITVDGALTDEVAPAGVVIRCVGEQLANAGASMALQGALGVLTLAAAPVAATGSFTVATGLNAADLDTVTVGETVYTFIAAGTPAAFEIPIGADEIETAANFAAAINGNIVGTDAHPRVTANDNLDGTVTLTAINAGTGGNNVETIEDGANLSFGAATLTGGTGTSFGELGLIVGEWVFLGGDVATNQLVNNIGYARIGVMTDTTLVFDKTTFDPVAEAGAGKDVRIFFGDVLRNEKDENLIVTRYYEYERSLGRDTDGPQAEYITRAVHNELTLNIPLGDKLNIDVSVVAGDSETRNGLEGKKEGARIAALGEDAYNTSMDIYRSAMSIVDPATSNPVALFAYITEATLTIVNNISPVKAIANLGSIDVSVGNFDVGGEVTALFSTVAAIRAVRNNADVTLDYIAAARNAGFIWDIPLLSLGNGQPEVSPGDPITIPLEQFGAENSNGYTLLYNVFPYLPTVAMPV